ncbi:MAG: hypothetical protein FJ313_02320, partial [Gemmatimonadetes bacterium]|nr:hypothetical protein [Gemmatimonadota bacterium]
MKRYMSAALIIVVLAAILIMAHPAQAASMERDAGADSAGVIRLERVADSRAGAGPEAASAPSVDGAPRGMGFERAASGQTVPRLYLASAARAGLPASQDLTMPGLPV